MSKVEIAALDSDRKRTGRRRKRRYSRVVRPDGGIETVYTFDVASTEFGLDFALVFQSAVNKARRENKKMLGAADVEPE